MLADRRLPAADKLVLLALQEKGWSTGVAFMGNAAIGAATALSECTVRRSLTHLNELGFIRRDRGAGNSSTRVELLWMANPALHPHEVAVEDDAGRDDSEGGYQPDTPGYQIATPPGINLTPNVTESQLELVTVSRDGSRTRLPLETTLSPVGREAGRDEDTERMIARIREHLDAAAGESPGRNSHVEGAARLLCDAMLDSSPENLGYYRSVAWRVAKSGLRADAVIDAMERTYRAVAVRRIGNLGAYFVRALQGVETGAEFERIEAGLAEG